MRSKSYSDKVRKTVLAKVRAYGGNCRKAALEFGVPPRTVVDWWRRNNARSGMSDEAKGAITAVAHLDGITQTAAAFGVPVPTVQRWMHGKVNDDTQASREEWNHRFVEETETLIDGILSEAHKKLDEANFAQLCTGLGILADRRQLALGAPTGIVQHQADPAEYRASLIQAALEAGVSFEDARDAALAIAEETGDRELLKLLPTLTESEPTVIDVQTAPRLNHDLSPKSVR